MPGHVSRLLLLAFVLLLTRPVLAQQMTIYRYDDGVTFEYPAAWEQDLDEDGVVVLTSDDSIVYVSFLIPDISGADLLLEVNPGAQASDLTSVNVNGQTLILYNYIDDYGDDALDIAIDFARGAVMINAYTFEGELEEYDTILRIASTIRHESGSDSPRSGNSAAVSQEGFMPVRAYSGPLPYFMKNECPLLASTAGEAEGESFECGTLFVREDHGNASSPVIELAVAIIYSSSDTAPDDPIIFLEGGPGGSALSTLDFWFTSGLRESRDIILIDQRGTGFSRPSLNCPEIEDARLDDPTLACRDRLLAAGVDLSAYRSTQSAADIDALIAALDYQQVNLYGVSYGTRLALTVMRDYPERIRSVILDAVYPPQVNSLNEQALNADRAFQTLFEGCAKDARCNAAYPNLRQVFYETVDRLNESPLIVPDSEGDEYELYGDDLANELFDLLYDTSIIPLLPGMIYRAYEGDGEGYADFGAELFEDDTLDLDALSDEEFDREFASFLGFADMDAFFDYVDGLSDDEYNALIDSFYIANGYSLDEYIDSDSEGVYNSVECGEEVLFNSLQAAEMLVQGLPPQTTNSSLLVVEQSIADCAVWNVRAAPGRENEPVRSDIPTLLLSGEYDPITPPTWGQAAADYLSRGKHIVFPGIGHGAVDTHPCPTAIALAFLENPEQTLDLSCLSEMSGPEFYIP